MYFFLSVAQMIRNFPCNRFHSNKPMKYKDIQALDQTTSVQVPKHVYKRTCMDDLKNLNKQQVSKSLSMCTNAHVWTTLNT